MLNKSQLEKFPIHLLRRCAHCGDEIPLAASKSEKLKFKNATAGIYLRFCKIDHKLQFVYKLQQKGHSWLLKHLKRIRALPRFKALTEFEEL